MRFVVSVGIHILTKILLPMKDFKIVVLAGFVEADFVLVPIDGLNHLKNVVQNYSCHLTKVPVLDHDL